MGLEREVPRIPVVKLSGEKLKGGSDSWNSAREEVRKALEKHGCFELVYNNFSTENHNTILEAADELYKVPDEIKAKHVNTVNTSISRFMRIVDPTNNQACQSFTHLMWPNGNQHFCETIHDYAIVQAEIQELVVKMLFESYGLDEECFQSHLKLTDYFMHILKYEKSNQGDTNLGFLRHSDKSFLTILHQNHVKGLEISLNDGEDDHWIFYEPSSKHSSFMVLAGDIFMGWSNDRIKSCSHRVMVEGEEDRYAIGFFGFIKGMIKAPKELVDEKHPLKYKPFNHDDYLEYFYTDPTSGTKTLENFCGI
ncbi:2-oxoglutarate (2OG) and Fe(II)-dependent oxygenase superfamily protein [Euphorbia peplus]|nr:2-oxoglutarate (2OG) and Fe(II)-dependent oxygenase superfamily protein [Euphorbia peplus]